jgi:cell division protein FtsN
LSKNRVIIILIALIVVGAGAAIFFLGGEKPAQEPARISKTIKIEVPEEPVTPVEEVAKVEPEPKLKPEPAPKPKVVKKAPAVKKVPARTSFKPWVINVASFSQRSEALDFAQAIRSAGYDPYITEFIMNNTKWHRVRIGFYETKAEAVKVGEELAKRFKQPGAWVVKPMRQEVLDHMQ